MYFTASLIAYKFFLSTKKNISKGRHDNELNDTWHKDIQNNKINHANKI
jgi:hypothetical protein